MKFGHFIVYLIAVVELIPHGQCRDCDAYFSDVKWFQQLKKEVNISLFSEEIACAVRPVPGKNRRNNLLVGIAVWEQLDVAIDSIENALAFTSSNTNIVLHVNKHLGTKAHGATVSPIVEKEFVDNVAQRLSSLFNQNVSDRLLLNPYRIEVEWMYGSILLSHLANFQAALSIGWKPSYYMLVASNSRFIKCGIEQHIATRKLSFGYKELCSKAPIKKNSKNSQAHTHARSYGLLALGSPLENKSWQFCISTQRVPNVKLSTGALVRIFLKFMFDFEDDFKLSQMDQQGANGASSPPISSVTEEMGNNTSAISFSLDQLNDELRCQAIWAYNTQLAHLKISGVISQRHEGAFFPSVVVESLSNFLAFNKHGSHDLQDDAQQIVDEKHSSPKNDHPHSHRGGSDAGISSGLALLENIPLPIEEMLLSTWLFLKFPYFIPDDNMSRDIPTYILSGTGLEITKSHVQAALKKSDYYLVKRISRSPVIPSPTNPNTCETVDGTLNPPPSYLVSDNVSSLVSNAKQLQSQSPGIKANLIVPNPFCP